MCEEPAVPPPPRPSPCEGHPHQQQPHACARQSVPPGPLCEHTQPWPRALPWQVCPALMQAHFPAHPAPVPAQLRADTRWCSSTPSPCANTLPCAHTPLMHTRPLCKPGVLPQSTQRCCKQPPRASAVPRVSTAPCTPSPRAQQCPFAAHPHAPPVHPAAGRTLVCARRGREGADALAGPKGSEGPEGLRGGPGEGTTHAGRFLHVHLTRGLAATRLADLGALRARVRVAAARERARQPLLCRHHLEPVPWGAPRGDTEGQCGHVGTPGCGHRWGTGGCTEREGTQEDMDRHGMNGHKEETWMGEDMEGWRQGWTQE